MQTHSWYIYIAACSGLFDVIILLYHERYVRLLLLTNVYINACYRVFDF